MRYQRGHRHAVLLAMGAALLLNCSAVYAQHPPAPQKTPPKAEPPRGDRPFAPPPGMGPHHAGLPPLLKGLHEAAKAASWKDVNHPAFGVAAALASGNSSKLLSEVFSQLLSGQRAKVLSEISPSLLSGNKPNVLSGNKPNVLSGNKPEVLSGNEAEIFSGNRISIFSNIKIEIHVTESGNYNGNQGPLPPTGPPRARTR